MTDPTLSGGGCFSWGSRALVAEKNFGIQAVPQPGQGILEFLAGSYGFVALIGTTNSTVTASNPPAFTWWGTTLTFLGSVTLNGRDTLLYGGTPVFTGTGNTGFQCASGTVFSGTVCMWTTEGVTGVAGPLQTATGTGDVATIDLTGGAGFTTFLMAFSTSGVGLVGTPGYGWPPVETIVDVVAPTVTLVSGGAPAIQNRRMGSCANLGVTSVMANFNTVATEVTLDWPLPSAQPWAIMAQPIG